MNSDDAVIIVIILAVGILACAAFGLGYISGKRDAEKLHFAQMNEIDTQLQEIYRDLAALRRETEIIPRPKLFRINPDR